MAASFLGFPTWKRRSHGELRYALSTVSASDDSRKLIIRGIGRETRGPVSGRSPEVMASVMLQASRGARAAPAPRARRSDRGDVLRDVALAHVGRCGLEVDWVRQLRLHLPASGAE